MLALVVPVVPLVERRGGTQLPVALLRAVVGETRRAFVAQLEAGGLRVDARAPVSADVDADAARVNVNTVLAGLLGGDGRLRRVNLEVFMVAVELREPDGGRAFREAERDAFVAQRDDFEDGVAADADEVSRVGLYFETRVAPRGERVALDERRVQLRALPLDASGALQADLAFQKTDAQDARVLLVFVAVGVVVGACRRRDEKQCGEKEEKCRGQRVTRTHGGRSFVCRSNGPHGGRRVRRTKQVISEEENLAGPSSCLAADGAKHVPVC